MKDATASNESIETRIRAVRREIRARQPIQQRIDLVRARHRARRLAKRARLR